MKERILVMIEEIKSGFYDQEIMHGSYDTLLEEFILNYDESLLSLMQQLIVLPKEFWYA